MRILNFPGISSISLKTSSYADLQRVSELAYKGLFKEDVQLVFTDDDDVIAENFHHLGLMNVVKEIYVCKGARTSYSFLHLSIQEFLAAWHVSIHELPWTFYVEIVYTVVCRNILIKRCLSVSYLVLLDQ